MPKRKAEAAPTSGHQDGQSPPEQQATLVNQRRVTTLRDASKATGPVIYGEGSKQAVTSRLCLHHTHTHTHTHKRRMSRDIRVHDNWALLQGCQEALQRSSNPVNAPPLAVAFNLVPEFLGAGARSFCFLLKVCAHRKRMLSILSQE